MFPNVVPSITVNVPLFSYGPENATRGARSLRLTGPHDGESRYPGAGSVKYYVLGVFLEPPAQGAEPDFTLHLDVASAMLVRNTFTAMLVASDAKL